MQRTPLIITVIVLLLLAGLGGYYFMNKSQTADVLQTSQSNKQTATTTTDSAMNTLKQLLASGQSQMCTFDYSDTVAGKISGTVYLAGGKMRNDFNIVSPDNKTTTGSMINDGTSIYNWTSEMPQGVKFSAADFMEASDATNSADMNKYLDPNKEANYKCSGWTTDPSKFTPPSNVQFMDVGAMMKQTQKQTQTQQGTKSAQCQACESLQGDQKATCKKTLSCP